jgi:hypothetical protein
LDWLELFLFEHTVDVFLFFVDLQLFEGLGFVDDLLHFVVLLLHAVADVGGKD